MNSKLKNTLLSIAFLSLFILMISSTQTVFSEQIKSGGKALKTCAKEYERTSGTVSPEYQYNCCNGLKTFITDEKDSGHMRIGGGLICAKIGFERIPNVKSIKNYKNIVKIGIGLYGYKK